MVLLMEAAKRAIATGGRPNRKSHVMTSSKFFEKRDFLRDKDTLGPGLACNLGFAKKKDLNQKLRRFSKLSKLGHVVSKLV